MSSRDRDAALAIPAWPVLQLVLDELGRATVDGRPLQIPPDTDPQAGLLAAATRRAADLGRPLRVRAIDPAGTWHLVAYPDGEVSELPGASDLPRARATPEADPERPGPEPHGPDVDDRSDDRSDEAGGGGGPDRREGSSDVRDPSGDRASDDDPEDPDGSGGSDDSGDQDNGWHLRVHPNGMIIPVEEVPASVDDDFISPPHTRWEPEARLAGEPVDRPAQDREIRPGAVPVPPPEPEPSAEPDPADDPGDDVRDDPAGDVRDEAGDERTGDPAGEVTDEPIAEELDAPAPEVDPELEPEPELEAALGPELEPVLGPELAADDDSDDPEAETTSPVRAEADPPADLTPAPEPEPEPDLRSRPEADEPSTAPATVHVPLVPLVDDTVRVPAPPPDDDPDDARPGPAPADDHADDDRTAHDHADDDHADDDHADDDRPLDGPAEAQEGWYHLGRVPDDPPPAADPHRDRDQDQGRDPDRDPDPDRDARPDPQARPGVDPDAIVHGMRSTLPSPPRQRSRRWIPVAAVTVVGAGLVVAIAVVASGGDPSPSAAPATGTPKASAASKPAASGAARAAVPPPTPPPTLSAPPAALAIGAPPGFTTTPVWGLPVSSSSTTTVSADGRIVTLTADRQVAIVDPASGAVQWHAATPSQAAGPYLSRIDGKPVVAMLTSKRLTYWTLPEKGAPAADAAPAELDLPSGSAVTWAGTSPLVTLGDGGVGVVQGGDVQRVSLPTGARALAADGGDVLAVIGRDWIRQPAGQAPGVPRQLAVPKGATGTAPLKVENVGGSFLGAMWAGADGPVVAVYDARSGGKLVQATFPKDVDFSSAATVREVGSERTVVGTALFEPAQHHLTILASSFTPVALAPGHVYANDTSGAVADLQINGTALKAVRFPSSNPTVPVGLANSGSRPLAIVVVPSGTGWLLCALPSA